MKRILFGIAVLFWFTNAWPQLRAIELSHYVFEDFKNGMVLMKDGTSRGAVLNYNSLSEEMVFSEKGKKWAIADEEILRIDSIFIENRVFFLLNNKFVELLFNSDTEFYAEYRCNVQSPGRPTAYGGTSRSTTSTSYGQLTYQTHIYELKLPDEFEVDPYIIYWLKKDGELHRILNLRQLNKIYSDKRNLIRDYQKENHVIFKQPETVVRFIEFLEEN
jgi:hypothetical protein